MAVLYGTNFDDDLTGANTEDWIYGAGGNDTLFGSGGNDLIWGGDGADVLTGGSGSDRFDYNEISQSTVGAEDTITDFHNNDKIYFQSINLLPSSHVTFTMVDDFTATGVLGEFRVVDTGHQSSRVEVDADGDGTADMAIVVLGATPDASDFML